MYYEWEHVLATLEKAITWNIEAFQEEKILFFWTPSK